MYINDIIPITISYVGTNLQIPFPSQYVGPPNSPLKPGLILNINGRRLFVKLSFSKVAVLLLLLVVLTADRSTASPQPGHLVHDFYKYFIHSLTKIFYQLVHFQMQQ